MSHIDQITKKCWGNVMDKKTKKHIKFVLSILFSILGVGGVVTLYNSYNDRRIKVEHNSGTIIGENKGIVKNYTMGGGSTKTKEKTKATPTKYKPSYVNDENATIHYKEDLQGVYIDNYSNSMEDVSFTTNFGNDEVIIVFGADHPNGYKLSVISQNSGYNLQLDDPEDLTRYIIDSYGNINEGAKVQISPYDFDDDGTNELIVCISDSFGSAGVCSVFSYTHVDDISKINPFKQELLEFIQNKIYLDGNSLQVIIGSQGIIDAEYKYVDEQFVITSQ